MLILQRPTPVGLRQGSTIERQRFWPRARCCCTHQTCNIPRVRSTMHPWKIVQTHGSQCTHSLKNMLGPTIILDATPIVPFVVWQRTLVGSKSNNSLDHCAPTATIDSAMLRVYECTEGNTQGYATLPFAGVDVCGSFLDVPKWPQCFPRCLWGHHDRVANSIHGATSSGQPAMFYDCRPCPFHTGD